MGCQKQACACYVIFGGCRGSPATAGWRPGRGLVFCARDLFGFCDILAIRLPDEVRFIQVTSGAVAVRRAKSFAVWPKAEIWEHLRAGVYRIHRADGQTEVVDVGAKK